MIETLKTKKSGSLLFPMSCLAALVFLAAIILYTESIFVMPKVGLLLDEGALNDAQATGIGYVAGLGEMMINWSVAIIGAIALSAKGIQNQVGMAKFFSGFSLILGFVASIVAIWLGMLVLDLTINSLMLEQDPLKNNTLALCRKWQYFAFVGALVLFIFSRVSAIYYAPPESKIEDQS